MNYLIGFLGFIMLACLALLVYFYVLESKIPNLPVIYNYFETDDYKRDQVKLKELWEIDIRNNPSMDPIDSGTLGRRILYTASYNTKDPKDWTEAEKLVKYLSDKRDSLMEDEDKIEKRYGSMKNYFSLRRKYNSQRKLYKSVMIGSGVGLGVSILSLLVLLYRRRRKTVVVTPVVVV